MAAVMTDRAAGPTAEAEVDAHRYTGAGDAFAEAAGVLNAVHGRLLDLVILTLADGHHVGPGLHTPGQYVAWKTGMAKATANRLVRIAKRVDELPCLTAALRAGEISLDQADAVAQLCPARYDRSATQLAKVATVGQLRTALAGYRDRPAREDRAREHGVSIRRDEHGATVVARMGNDEADLFEQALDAMREDLYRQRRIDAEAAGAGDEPEPPTGAEALVAMAETALTAGEAAHPGSDRYLVSYHLHAGPDGHLSLTDDRGRRVDDADRRRILCDCAGEAVFHSADGTPLSVGRKTRTVGRKLRRAILFRHRHRCAVPGCDRSRGLDIHHIVHWEDGGSTDTANLVALCRWHHKAHHLGLLDIHGDADLPPGTPGALVIAEPEGPPILSAQPPVPPRRGRGPVTTATVHQLHREFDARTGRPHRRRYRPPVAHTPSGERLRRRDVHLQADPPDPPLRT